jgi:hypothetical protein
MAGNGGEQTKPIAQAESDFDPEERGKQQGTARNRWQRARPVVVYCLGGGGVMGIFIGALPRLVSEPYNFWSLAVGIAASVAGMSIVFQEHYPEFTQATVTVVILSVVLLGMGAVKESKTSEQQQVREVAVTPSPSPPVFEPEAQFAPPRFEPEISSEVIVTIGGATSNIPRSRILPCPPYRPDEPYTHPPSFPIPAFVNGLVPVSLCAENGRILADVKLWNDPTKPQAEIIHDHFAIQPPGWDWNFDNEAFEAVDEQRRPMLQLVYRSPSEIDVRGLFITGGLAWLFSNDAMVGPIPSEDSDRVMTEHPITRIFKYPHEKFLHIRE